MLTRSITAALLGASLLSACATPQGEGSDMPSGDLVLRATGSGTWSIDCNATSVRGRPAASDISANGGESTDVIALREITEASCSYQTGTSPVQLTLEEEGLACPFGDFDMGLCRTVLPAESTGMIDFVPS